MAIRIARVYDLIPGRRGEYRVLVDLVWPRGVRKKSLALDKRFKEIGPSTALRNGLDMTPPVGMPLKKSTS